MHAVRCLIKSDHTVRVMHGTISHLPRLKSGLVEPNIGSTIGVMTYALPAILRAASLPPRLKSGIPLTDYVDADLFDAPRLKSGIL